MIRVKAIFLSRTMHLCFSTRSSIHSLSASALPLFPWRSSTLSNVRQRISILLPGVWRTVRVGSRRSARASCPLPTLASRSSPTPGSETMLCPQCTCNSAGRHDAEDARPWHKNRILLIRCIQHWGCCRPGVRYFNLPVTNLRLLALLPLL